MRALVWVVSILVGAVEPLTAQISWAGCLDAAGRPVPHYNDLSLNDIAQATLAPNGTPVIRYNSEVVGAAGPVVGRFFYLHECSHHALGQVIRMSMGQVNPFPYANEQEADCAAIRHLVNTGEFGDREVAIVQRALYSNAGDQTHFPGPIRSTNLRACLGSSPGNDRNGRGNEVAVSLRIWSRSTGNLTTLSVSIDGQFVGTLSNLSSAEELDIGPLTPGQHTFELTDMTIYNGYGQPVASGYSCVGRLYIQREARLNLWARLSPTGAVTCGMQ